MNSDIVLRCSEITKSFPTTSGSGELRILKGVNLDLHSGEIAAIVGSSGSGKSTLLHIIGGLDQPTSGTLHWSGKSITSYNPEQLAELRNQHIGFVFQFHHLLPEFTALENVMMPSLIRGDSFSQASVRAEFLLDEFGLSERLQHRPSQLSGGEQQRVSLARALANQPMVILADEPTGNLDENNTHTILRLLFRLRDTENISIILITHEKEIARQCDTLYTLSNGILEKGL
ncbi:MAG: ABC transporter ATP-binding protein [Balneolaceae bacterium]|nr:MAG: ABC transporter ATP-binding protein [Balneolaceae bacterium]